MKSTAKRGLPRVGPQRLPILQRSQQRDEMYSGTEVKPPQVPTSSYTKHLPVSFPAGSAYPVAIIDVNLRFGLRLRSLRREHHWTQLDMAVTLGINRSYISEVERGHKSISLGLLEVIALGFHMSIADLLNGI